MGNRLLPRSDGACCVTLDTSADGGGGGGTTAVAAAASDRLTLDAGTAGTGTAGDTPPPSDDSSTAAEQPVRDELKPPTLTPVRNSFEIMSEFTWEMV